MEHRDAYHEQVDARIRDWEGHVVRLEAQAERSEAERKEREEGIVGGLREKLEEVKRAAAELSRADREAWNDLKTGVDRALADLEGALDKAKRDMT